MMVWWWFTMVQSVKITLKESVCQGEHFLEYETHLIQAIGITLSLEKFHHVSSYKLDFQPKVPFSQALMQAP